VRATEIEPAQAVVQDSREAYVDAGGPGLERSSLGRGPRLRGAIDRIRRRWPLPAALHSRLAEGEIDRVQDDASGGLVDSYANRLNPSEAGCGEGQVKGTS